MTTYTLTQTNKVGFPNLDAQNGNPTFQTILDPVFEFGDDYSVDLIFAYNGTETYLDANIQLVSFSSEFNVFSVTQIDNKTLRLTGRATDVFLDQYYEFNMSDSIVDLKRLPPDTTEPFAALVSYEPPAVFRITKQHTINYIVTYTPNPLFTIQPLVINITTVFDQDIVWSYNMTAQRLQTLILKGRV